MSAGQPGLAAGAPPAAASRRRPWPSDPWDRATVALLAALSLLVLATFRRYGGTLDEEHQRRIGQALLAWYESGFADRTALAPGATGNYYLYGALFDGLAEMAVRWSPLRPLETRHLVSALWGLAGIAGAALLARRVGGPRAGLLAAALLAGTPAWWGQQFGNPKDVPFAAPVPWALWALLRAADDLPRLRVPPVVLAGLALGAALGVRPGGWVALLPLATAAWAGRALPVLAREPPGRRAGAAARALAAPLAVVAVAWVVMLAAWPYGQVRPLSAPWLVASEAARFSYQDLTLRFAGAWYATTALPRSYVPVYFALTLPETWFVCAGGALAGAAVAVGRPRALPLRARPRTLDAVVLLAAGLGPPVAAVALRSSLYDGIRHLLFALPPLSALSAGGLVLALDRLPRWAGRALVACLGVAAAVLLHDAARLFPYEYVYFNRSVAGGVRRAAASYDLDTWGMSYREGIEWLARNHRPSGAARTRVNTLCPPSIAWSWIEDDAAALARLEVAGSPTCELQEPADVVLATTRWFRHRTPGRVLHVVERMGAPLLYVIDLDPAGLPAPRVLEGGDAAVELVLAPGALVRPKHALEHRRSLYELDWPGEQSWLELKLMTQATGGVPVDEELERQVVAAARDWGFPPAMAREGPLPATGVSWFTATAGSPGGGTLVAAAARVGDSAVLVQGRSLGGPEAARRLLEAIRSLRPAGPDGRRWP
jgi:4-amino-4-deoxy-L-arabinose transferase-like glycosyltransferase